MPVINALTDTFHPLQALADLQTICEAFAPSSSSSLSANITPLAVPQIKIAWVGDANNILNSLLVSLPRLGIRMGIATPIGYDPPQQVLDFAYSNAFDRKNIRFSRAPLDAVQGADVIITDTWVSMGMEADKAKRLNDFKGFKVGHIYYTKTKEMLILFDRLQEPSRPMQIQAGASCTVYREKRKKLTTIFFTIPSDLLSGKRQRIENTPPWLFSSMSWA